MDLTIVVPTYHEAANATELVQRIESALGKFSHEILFVDDNSCDGIDDVVTGLAQDGIPVNCIVRTKDRGLSKSVLHGFNQAKGDILVCMDADLSHPPEALPELIKPLVENQAEFTIGSRYVPGGQVGEDWNIFRALNSSIATLLSWPLHGGQVKDPMAGFFALPAKVFKRSAPVNPIGWKIGLELLVKCKCHPIIEVPIQFKIRTVGESKLNLKEQVAYLQHLGTLYWFKATGRSW